MTDVSDADPAAGVAAESERRVREILDGLPVAVAVATDMNVSYANPAALELFGCDSLSQFSVRFAARAHVHPDEQQRLTRVLPGILDGTRTPRPGEWRLVRPDGTERTTEWRLLPLALGGEVVRLVMVTDTTDAAHSRRVLAASEAHSRSVFDNVGEGVAVLDRDGRFVDLNGAMATVLGIEEPDLLLGTAIDAIPLVDRSLDPIAPHPACTAISGGSPVGPLTVGVGTPKGFRWIEVTFVPLVRFGEEPDGVLVSLHDVTEQLATLDALAESEARFRNLTMVSPVGIFETDLDGSCVYVNRRWMEMTGLTMEQARGDAWGRGVYRDDREQLHRTWQACMASREPFIAEFRCVDRSGRPAPVHAEATVIHDAEGRPTGWIGTVTDLSAQAELRAALAESEARFRGLAERSPDVITRIAFDPFRFEYISPALTTLCGLTPQTCYDDPVALLRVVHPHDVERVKHLLLEGEPAPQIEFRVVRPDGTVRTLDVRIAAIRSDGRVVGLDTTARDVTEAVAHRDRLADLAHRDPLTGLMNRRALKAVLGERMAEAKPTAVLFIDLDEFKVVNDRFGHDAGDAVLIAISERLLAAVRSEDQVARFAGDEFVIATHPEAAGAIAARLIEHLSAPITLPSGLTTSVGASIGVTLLPGAVTGAFTGDAKDPVDEVLRRADEGMYLAKRRGKGQIVRI